MRVRKSSRSHTDGVRTWAIVVAAGGGTRFGAAKQFAARSAVRAWSNGRWRPPPRRATAWSSSCPPARIGGHPTGCESQSAARRAPTRCAPGSAQVPDDVDIVVVHDAARPLASRRLFDLVVQAVAAGADGAVPALPVADTLKRVDGDRVVETVSRDGLVAVQTPQAFRADGVACGACRRRGRHRRRGARRGERRRGRGGRGRAHQSQDHRRRRSRARARAARRCDAMRNRVGLGFDIHPFGDAPPLVLGGVRIDGSPRLAGHSDGDAVAHAVADALLGPAGLPDLGTLFPRRRRVTARRRLDGAARRRRRPGGAARLVGRERRHRDRGRAHRSWLRTSPR